MSDGWIKLHRKLNEWEWATKPETFNLFIHILLNANHKDGKWRGISVPAGSYLTGRKSLSSKTGLSERQVRTALTHLKSTNEVTIQSTNEYSIISVTNWKLYQHSDQPNANERPASDQQATTNKNDNNEKNEKEDKDNPPWFDGHVIRLRKKDYENWLKMTGWTEEYFAKVLSDRDDWLADNPVKATNWFMSTSKFLQNAAKG